MNHINAMLVDSLNGQGKYENAKAVLNTLINNVCKQYNNELNNLSSNTRNWLAILYSVMGDLCHKLPEPIPEKACKLASEDIKSNTDKGNKVLQKRANGIEYIGDLRPEAFQ